MSLAAASVPFPTRSPALETASDALGEHDRVLAYAAHELRTPLTTQRALLELALADPDTDAASWREIGEDVLLACRRQEHLLEACLALARGKDGARQREPVDLAAIATGVLRAQEACGLQRVVSLDPAWTMGDAALLERLVANLVSNAARHNLLGGWIEAATRTASGRALLLVANSGPLVPPGDLERLFRPSQRLAGGALEGAVGVGLGLAIVRAIADAHGARLTARARPGGGLAIAVAFSPVD